jgi:dUTPase
MSLLFQKLSQHATSPTKATPGSAGWELYSAGIYTIPAYGKAVIHTDIIMIPPSGTYLRIAGLTSLAAYQHLDIAGGVIDSDDREVS